MFEQDLPITSAEQDIFNRKKYTCELSEGLLKSKYESSFVVGLYGAWGSGKTSLLNMILEKITNEKNIKENSIPKQIAQTINLRRFSKEEKIIIFQFNPWMCTNPHQLVNQFFLQLANEFKKNNINSDIFYIILKYSKIVLSSNPKQVGFIRFIINYIFQINAEIQSVKKKFIKIISEENIKLFITIDDIDRLSEQEIIAVFQLVKALGDFPNTIYFLSFDYEIVTNALNKIHENKGKEYLEKIVQVSIPMPKAKSIDLERIFNSKLESLLSEQEKNNFHEQDVKFRWYEIYEGGIKSYINSIRDINRFMNTFSLIFQQIGNETDFIDLVGITCLQVFEPNLYNILPQLKGIFFTKTILDEKRKEKIEENIKLVNIFLDDKKITKHKKPAEKILKVLFAGMLFMRSESEEKKRINKNNAYEHAFDRYFSFSLHGAEISKVQIENILYKTDENDQYNLLNSIFISCNFNEIIKDIFSYYHEDNQENFPSSQQTQNLFKNLTLLWETVAKDEQGFFSIPENWRYDDCISLMIIPLPFEEQKYFLENLFLDERISPTMLSRILIYLQYKNKTTLPQNFLSPLQNSFINRANLLLNSENITSKNNIKIDFIWLLKEYSPEQTKKKVVELLEKKYFLAKFINYCTQYGTQPGGTISSWSLSIYHLQQFLTNEEALNYADKLTKDKEFLELNEETQLNITALIVNLNNNLKRTQDDHFSLRYDQIKPELERIKKTLQ